MNKYLLAFTSLSVTLILSGCAGSDFSDLDEWARDIRSKQKPKIEPLPEFKPYPIFVYEAGDLRDPFAESDFIQQQANFAIEATGGIQPPSDHKKEPLEEYPLDTLRMVGTLEQAGTIWALVRDGEGSIHRVKTGNYLGKNYGKIISINEHQVDILEIVPNGLGAYVERPATIALSE